MKALINSIKMAGLIACLFLLAPSAAANPLEHEVVFMADNGYRYILPAYKNVGESLLPVTPDEFYTKSESGSIIDITDPEMKAYLYAVSLMASNLSQENYWRVRREAEDGFGALLAEVDKVRSEVVKLPESGASVLMATSLACATYGTKGAVVGTIILPIAGTVKGAGAGCLMGGGVVFVTSLGDEVLASIIKGVNTHSGTSRENIALSEAVALLSLIYEASGQLRAESIRWINNKESFSLQQIQEIADLEIYIAVMSGHMWSLLEILYPESDVVRNRKLSYLSTAIGFAGNAVESTGDLGYFGLVPVSSLTEISNLVIKAFSSELTPNEALVFFESIVENNLYGDSGIREWMKESSPLSLKNINNTRSYFESLVPVEYSGSFLLGPSLVDSGDDVPVRTILQQGGSFYGTGQVSYELRNPNGSLLSSGNAINTGSEYQTTLRAPSFPGKYTVHFTARDGGGNVIGHKSVQFEVNNPLSGRDLAINTLTQSRQTAIQGQHSVHFSVGVHNRGVVTEQVRARLTARNQENYNWTGPEQVIGTIDPNEIKNFNNAMTWTVPNGLADGSYTLSVSISNGVGDITPNDNVSERFVYVGNYNVTTPQSLIGKEIQASWKPDIELRGECGTPSGWGAYGWVTYNRGGNTYAIAVSGAISGSGISKDVCVVVRQGSSTGSLVYSSGRLNERVGRPIYIPGTPLILFPYPTGDIDILEFVVAESYSGIGFDVRERTAVPGLKTEYNSQVGSISCASGHTYIHQASFNSGGQWNFNIAYLIPGNINYQIGLCNSNGRQVFLSSSAVGRHGFVIEHRSSFPPSGYNPVINGASKVSSHTFFWLTGILDVRDYRDMSLVNANSSSPLTSGRHHDLMYKVNKLGTLDAASMNLFLQIRGPDGYALDLSKTASAGMVNNIGWDTLDLAAGEYEVQATLSVIGDSNLDDNVVTHIVTLVDATPVSITGFALPVLSNTKTGATLNLSGSLGDFNNQCRNDGIVLVEQIDAESNVLSTYVMSASAQGCEYSAGIRLVTGVSSIRVIGRLERHSVSYKEMAISVVPNLRPVATISPRSFEPNELVKGDSIGFSSQYEDPDDDGIADWIWELRNPDGSLQTFNNVGTILLTFDNAGVFELNHFVMDSLGAVSDIDSISFHVGEAPMSGHTCSTGENFTVTFGPQPGETREVQGCRTIIVEAGATVPATSVLALAASERIRFRPGFRVESGGRLTAAMGAGTLSMSTLSSEEKSETTVLMVASTNEPTGSTQSSGTLALQTFDADGSDGTATATTGGFDDATAGTTLDLAGLCAAPPAELAAVAGDQSVQLTWSAVPEGGGYQAYWSLTPGIHPYTAASYLGFAEVQELAHAFAGLENDQEHYFVVTVTCGDAESPPSVEVTATPRAGPPLVAGRYRLGDVAEGTVEDVATGLQWMRCALGQRWDGGTCVDYGTDHTYENALQTTATLNERGGYAGFTDWRVPTLHELQGLVYCSSGVPSHFKGDDPSICQGSHGIPTLEPEVFPASSAEDGWFWSSTPDGLDGDQAWGLDFTRGDSHAYSANLSSSVRLVREVEKEGVE